MRLFGDFGIGAGQFDPGAVGGEHPLDVRAAVVALVFPCLDLADQTFALADAAIQALAAQHADFDFNHVQPAGMLRRIMKLQPLKHPVRLVRREGSIECTRGMRGQIVQNHPDVWKSLFDLTDCRSGVVGVRPIETVAFSCYAAFAGFCFSRASAAVSRNVCIGVLPKHHRP